MAWNAPATWVAGAVLTAAQLNAQVRDNFKAIGDPWASWAPAWTATTNPVIGNGSLTAGVSLAGKMVNFWIHLVAGSTTTFGTGGWQFNFPAGESAHRWIFQGVARDASAALSWPIMAERTAAGVLLVRALPSVAGSSFANVNATSPFTWATSDELFLSGTYEAA